MSQADSRKRNVNRPLHLLLSEASDIMKSIGEAIQYLHAINIAHRDVKVCVLTPWFFSET